jgi:hypothetical protein
MARREVQSCRAAIRGAAPNLTDQEVEDIVEAMIRRDKGKPDRRGDALRWAEIAKEKTAEELLKLKIERHARQAALIARTRRETQYDAYTDAVKAVSDRISTSSRSGAGRAVSAEAAISGLQGEYQGALLHGWEKAGVLPWFRAITPEQEAGLAREIARLNGAAVEATTNAQIRRAAEVVVALQARHREDANAAGAWVQKLDGRVSRTSHDARRMQAQGFEAWRDFVVPRLDARTWDEAGIDPGDAEAANKFLTNIYNNLVSGNHHVAGKGDLDPLGGFSAPGSLARRLSEDRVLHWRGPDEWLAYNREFGTAGLVAGIVSENEHAARSIGLMRVWGPNPDAALQQDVQRIADRLRDEGKPDASRALSEALIGGTLRREWAVATGEAERPVNTTMAHGFAAWRALEAMTSLGGMVLSAVPDVGVIASALRHEGVNYWSAMGNQVAALLPGRGQGQREVALRVRAGVNNLLGGLYHRMGYDLSAPGRISRGMDVFFKLNLQNWWQDAMERGVAGTLSAHVADSLSLRWDAIDPRQRAALERFGIGESDWTAAQAAEKMDADGVTYFTPDMVEGEARQRWSAYFAETMNTALTRPGVFERSILTGGQQAGTPLGEALRMFTQFKSYPLAFANRHLTREFSRGMSTFDTAVGVGGLIAGTTILGYVSTVLKDYAAGRNPREPEDAQGWAKLVTRAMVQGGGLGIYGDFLFGDYNRFGGGFLDTLAGPGFGTLTQAGRILANMREGEFDNAASGAVGFAAREVLPTNIFYMKLALDHLFIYELQEAVNPGYLRRLERRVERDNDQTWWLPPTDALR